MKKVIYSFFILSFLACTIDSENTITDKESEKQEFNFLDSLAGALQSEEDALFDEQTNDGEFFSLETMVSPKITGNVWPQANSIGETHYAFDFHSFPDSSFEMGVFELEPNAKFTDVMSTSISAVGLLMSPKAKKIFEAFNLGKHKFYPCIVDDLKGESRTYFYLQLIADLDADEYINFEKSEFVSFTGLSPTESDSVIQFASNQEYLNYKADKYDRWKDGIDDKMEMVDVKQLFINNLDTSLSIFMFSKMTQEIYASKELATALKVNGITGIEIKSTNRLILD